MAGGDSHETDAGKPKHAQYVLVSVSLYFTDLRDLVQGSVRHVRHNH